MKSIIGALAMLCALCGEATAEELAWKSVNATICQGDQPYDHGHLFFWGGEALSAWTDGEKIQLLCPLVEDSTLPRKAIEEIQVFGYDSQASRKELGFRARACFRSDHGGGLEHCGTWANAAGTGPQELVLTGSELLPLQSDSFGSLYVEVDMAPDVRVRRIRWTNQQVHIFDDLP